MSKSREESKSPEESDPIADFVAEREARIAGYPADAPLQEASDAWLEQTFRARYSYNFTWLGRPIIQYPQDILALQEIIWRTRPDVIVETGIAHGGSLVFHASMLELVGGKGKVIGVDIDIRAHNRAELERHPMMKRVQLVQGSSIDDDVVAKLREEAAAAERVMVVLDSNHSHAHVLRELQLYSELVSVGCYLCVMDTMVEDLPAEAFADRPWSPGNSPKTAVHAFLEGTDRFAIDERIQQQLLVTVAPDGYLQRVR